VGALVPLEEAHVGVSGPCWAARFDWQWGLWARPRGQRRERGYCCIRSHQAPSLYPLGPSCSQAQAAHFTLVVDVHLGGEAH
jgi:hypothetical protein